MAHTTPVYALPYPDETDRADVPADVHALALRIEAVLPNVGMPTGMGADWYASVAPAGFLLCDGSAVSRATFAALFAAIGTTWGAGDGSSTFNLPDTRARVVVGLNPGGANHAAIAGNDGTAAGARRVLHGHSQTLALGHTLTLPNHGHGVNDPGHGHNNYSGSGGSTHASIQYTATGDNQSGVGTVIMSNPTGLTVGNPTSTPAIPGGVSVTGGGVGLAGGTQDGPSFVVVAKVIKT